MAHFVRPSLWAVKRSVVSRLATKVSEGPSRHAARCNNIVRICPIARVGFKPLGHTATQFWMPRQRNTLNGSSKLDSRCSVALCRLSATNRYACNKPAGPLTLYGFHQNEGQAVKQEAHKHHP